MTDYTKITEDVDADQLATPKKPPTAAPVPVSDSADYLDRPAPVYQHGPAQAPDFDRPPGGRSGST